MKAKIIPLLGMICVLLVGCNVAKDDARNSLGTIDPISIGGKPLETVLPTNEDDEKSAEEQDTQGEEPAVEGNGSSLTEEQDTQREESAIEGNGSNPAEVGVGGRVEGCYDDPNNPVKDQNYNVGSPKYE